MHTLSPSELHLWRLDSGSGRWSKYLPYFTTLLSNEELHRLASFRYDHPRQTFIITRAFCRLLLSRYVPAVSPRSWQFRRNDYGRPSAILPGDAPAIDFNISHSAGQIVIAVAMATYSIGVDIEEMALTPDQLAITAQFFSQAEQDELGRQPDALRKERFFELWTAKEAYIKARGMGLSIPLNAFSVAICRTHGADTPLQARLTAPPAHDGDAEQWRFMLSEFPPRYKLALCARVTNAQEVLRLKYADFEC